MKVTMTSSLTRRVHTREIDIDEYQWERIRSNEGLVQNIVPHLSAEDREFLISGITPEEWKEIME